MRIIHRLKPFGTMLLIRAAIAMVVGGLIAIGLSWYLVLQPTPTFTFTHQIQVTSSTDASASYRQSCSVCDEYRPAFRRLEIRSTQGPITRSIADQIEAELATTDHTPVYPNGMTTMQQPQRPLWLAWIPKPSSQESSVDRVSARASGWPYLCLCSTRVHTDGSSEDRIRGVLPLGVAGTKITSDPDSGSTMLIPIWPGLLANAALFGSPFLLVMLSIRAVRYTLRVGRSLCTRCSYDLHATGTGSPCPECGYVRLAVTGFDPAARRLVGIVPRLARIRKMSKWSGAVVSSALLLIWISSGWWGTSFDIGNGNFFAFGHGSFAFTHSATVQRHAPPPPSLSRPPVNPTASPTATTPVAQPQSTQERTKPPWIAFTPSATYTWGFDAKQIPGGFWLRVPIWPVLALSLGLIFLAWRLDAPPRRQ